MKKLHGVAVDDTFAEAFPMRATRLLVTARTPAWAMRAGCAATGFATSVIACGCEAGIERELSSSETPDGRPGIAILLFATSAKELRRQVQNRVGQCILTCPSSACFSGLEQGEALPLGRGLRYFGDGHQVSKKIGKTRYWRIPVMDGEFLIEEDTRMIEAVGGGNFLVLGRDEASALAAAEAAVTEISGLPGTITPFPGGIVRSGSKVGSKYAALPASTNDAYCPTLRGQTRSALGPEVGCVLEVVIDGLDEDAVAEAMRAGIRAACKAGANDGGVRRIGAGNYGGSLGPFHFHLHRILA